MYRSAVCMDNLNPTWDEYFHVPFGAGMEPLMLVFDVFDKDNEYGELDGDHLGSCLLLLQELSEVKVKKRFLLHEGSQFLPTWLDRCGRTKEEAEKEENLA